MPLATAGEQPDAHAGCCSASRSCARSSATSPRSARAVRRSRAPHPRARLAQRGAARVHRALRGLPPDHRPRAASRPARACPPLQNATRRRRSPRRCGSGPTSCRASRRQPDQRPRAGLDHRYVQLTPPPDRPRRLGDRPPRPVPGGDRRLAAGRRRARRRLHRHRPQVAGMRRLGRLAARGAAARARAPPRCAAAAGAGAAEPIVAPAAPDRRAENAVLALLCLAALAALAFVAIYALDDGARDRTQLYGLTLGLALAFVAAALIVLGRRLVAGRGARGGLPGDRAPRGAGRTSPQIVRESAGGMTRKRLLLGAGGGAGRRARAGRRDARAVARALADTDALVRDARGSPAGGSSTSTARRCAPGRSSGARSTRRFPEDARHDDLAAPLVLVRLDPADLRLPPERAQWAPRGHPRLLEDLHPRRLRDLAVPRAAVRADRAAPRARLPVPLLDVRPGRRRQRALRTGRPPAAAASRCGSTRAESCAPPATSRARSGRPGRACAGTVRR